MRDVLRRLLCGLGLSLVAAALAATASGCALDPANGDHIAVNGVDGGNSGGFVYSIDNRRIMANGLEYSFTLGKTKSELFDGLRSSYRVFDENDSSILVIYNQQIYSVRCYADGHYALYGEMFWFKDRYGARQKFPFPTEKMSGEDEDSPQPYVSGTEFTMNADLPYLRRFYEVYGDAVKAEGNKITYASITITVEPGGLVKVDGP